MEVLHPEGRNQERYIGPPASCPPLPGVGGGDCAILFFVALQMDCAVADRRIVLLPYYVILLSYFSIVLSVYNIRGLQPEYIEHFLHT